MKFASNRGGARTLIAALAIVAFTSSALGADGYTLTPFNVPGSISTTPRGINDAGDIVGFYQVEPGGPQIGFVYRNGFFSPVTGPDGATGALVQGISNSGVIVGSFQTAATNYRQQSFLFDGLSYTVLSLPFGDGAVRGISPIGRYLAGDVYGNRAGFVLDRLTGQAQTFGVTNWVTVSQGVNDDGLVVGSRGYIESTGGTTKAFVFNAVSGLFTENPQDYPGIAEARPRAINNAGLVGGFAFGLGAFIRDGGQMTVLPAEPGGFLAINSLNRNGVGVGHGYLASDTEGLDFGFVATPVPEPKTLLLWMAGFAMLATRGRHLTRHCRA